MKRLNWVGSFDRRYLEKRLWGTVGPLFLREVDVTRSCGNGLEITSKVKESLEVWVHGVFPIVT